MFDVSHFTGSGSASRFALRRRRLALIASLAMFCLITLLVRPASAALDGIVVVVDNDPIMQSELTASVREIVRDMRRRKAKIPEEQVLIRQTLESMIRERVLLQAADSRGVRVAPTDVDRALLTVAQQNKLSPRDFRAALDKEGIDFGEYRKSVEDRLRVQRLVDREMASQVVITDEEVELQVNAGGGDSAATEYDISRILIAVPQGSDNAGVELIRGKAELVLDRIRADFAFEDAAAEFSQAPDALQGGRVGWRKSGQLPALYLGAIIGMEEGAVSDLVRGPNGFHIIKLNGRRSDDQKIVTQYEMRQILMRPSATRSDQDVINRLQLLRERLIQGEDFSSIASAHTEDPVSQSSDGLVGWVALAELPEQLREPMSRLKVGEVSEPIRSPFGYHLMLITGSREQDVTDDIRRNRARQEIYSLKSEQFYDDWVRELRDKAYIDYRIPL